MKPEEALEKIKGNCEKGDACSSCELCEVIVEALEKQIPKKPVIDEYPMDDYWNCPVCDSRFGGFGMLEPTNYCHVCGQKIDWED